MSEVILRRRDPLDVIRYVLQKLEKQAVAAGSFPTLIHEGLEAEEKARAEMERLRDRLRETEEELEASRAIAEAALRGGGE